MEQFGRLNTAEGVEDVTATVAGLPEVPFRYTFDNRGYRCANTIADYEALDLAQVLREYRECCIPLELKVVDSGVEYAIGLPDETGWRTHGICFKVGHLAGKLHNDLWWQMPEEWKRANMERPSNARNASPPTTLNTAELDNDLNQRASEINE